MRNEFSAIVKMQMEAKDISLRELARKMKVQPSYLSRILTGRRKTLPSIEVIAQIAHHLEIENPGRLFIAAGRTPSSDPKTNNAISELLLKLGEDRLNKFARKMQNKAFFNKVFGMIGPSKGKKK